MLSFLGAIFRNRKPAAPVRPKFEVEVQPHLKPEQLQGWDQFVREQFADARTPAERRAAAQRIMAFRKEKLGH